MAIQPGDSTGQHPGESVINTKYIVITPPRIMPPWKKLHGGVESIPASILRSPETIEGCWARLLPGNSYPCRFDPSGMELRSTP